MGAGLIKCPGSKNNEGYTGYELRCVSPWFKREKMNDYWTEEEEKNPDKFKKSRFSMLLGLSHFNIEYLTLRMEYRAMNKGRFSTFLTYGGELSAGASDDLLSVILGVDVQYNLGVITPYFDVNFNTGEQFILACGTRVNLKHIHAVRLKKRYNLHLKNNS